jgi:hypothetical protein
MEKIDEEHDCSQAFEQIYRSIHMLRKRHARECDRNINSLSQCKEEIEAMIHSELLHHLVDEKMLESA